MGNCQAAEAATVVIQHPGGGGVGQQHKVERFYWSVTANEIMNSHPGHYVALVVSSAGSSGTTHHHHHRQKHLKLLRPDDTLLMGHVYRLVSFQDVLKEFAAKKCVKLGKLLKERGGLAPGLELDLNTEEHSGGLKPNPTPKSDKEVNRVGSKRGSSSSSSSRGNGTNGGGVVVGRQWKPALESISEIGT